jgi:hypothetical protein
MGPMGEIRRDELLPVRSFPSPLLGGAGAQPYRSLPVMTCNLLGAI